jgi:hypothetical protein
VLLFLNILQLMLYIGLLCLVGQGVVYLFAGAKRNSNFAYQIFQILNKPWTKVVRWITPKQVADHQVPITAFFMLSVLYIAVTLAKVEHCVSVAMQGCK